MKKRIICAALALAMVLSLCGCGSDGKYKVVKSLGSQAVSYTHLTLPTTSRV